MDTKIGIGVILVVGALVLVIGLLQRKASFLLRFLVRMVVGGAAIYFTNMCLASMGIALSVALNVFTLITVGALGIGGYGMLYAILLYINL